MSEFNGLDRTSLALVTVGAVDLGIRGLGVISERNLEPISLALGSIPAAEGFVYIMIGLAGLYQVYFGYRMYQD